MTRELAHVYDLDAVFGHFFHVARFRQVQARTGAIITGSHVLAFMGLYGWECGSRLDVVLPVSGAAMLASFLLAEDYEYMGGALDVAIARLEDMQRFQYAFATPLSVLLFRRASVVGETTINVLVSVSPVECILGFHSSASVVGGYGSADCVPAIVMNGIAWNCAFSLFPRATFVNRRGLITAPVRHLDEVALAQDRARGFRTARDWLLVGAKDLADLSPMLHRRVGDESCWMMYFDPPVHPIHRAVHCIERNAFRILRAFVGSPGQLQASAYRLDVTTVSSPLLRHRYTAPVALWVFAGGILSQLHSVADDVRWDGEPTEFLAHVRMCVSRVSMRARLTWHSRRRASGIYAIVDEPLRTPEYPDHSDVVYLAILTAFLSSLPVIVCDAVGGEVRHVPLLDDTTRVWGWEPQRVSSGNSGK